MDAERAYWAWRHANLRLSRDPQAAFLAGVRVGEEAAVREVRSYFENWLERESVECVDEASSA